MFLPRAVYILSLSSHVLALSLSIFSHSLSLSTFHSSTLAHPSPSAASHNPRAVPLACLLAYFGAELERRPARVLRCGRAQVFVSAGALLVHTCHVGPQRAHRDDSSGAEPVRRLAHAVHHAERLHAVDLPGHAHPRRGQGEAVPVPVAPAPAQPVGPQEARGCEGEPEKVHCSLPSRGSTKGQPTQVQKVPPAPARAPGIRGEWQHQQHHARSSITLSC